MKIVEPSYQIIDRDNALTPAQKIERVGRVCYKSEDKTTLTSAIPFVKRLIDNGHEAMLEHASILFTMSLNAFETLRRICSLYEECTGKPCFLRRSYHPAAVFQGVVSGNIRAWRDLVLFAAHRGGDDVAFPYGIFHLWTDFPEFFLDCPPADEKPCLGAMGILDTTGFLRHGSPDQVQRHYSLTVQFDVDIAVARELCRHRLASHAGASTRYCDYANGKFGGETTTVMPSDPFNSDWVRSARYAEEKYLSQRQDGVPPEIARSALTLSTLGQHVMTATLEQWKHIFALRALDKTGKAHPQMKQVMLPLYQECKTMFPQVFEER